MKSIQRKRRSRPMRRSNGGEGCDFVRCRICGDHRRVIRGRHLSKHGTDREEYMEEYALSPDELIAKDFRRMRSSRRGFCPHGNYRGNVEEIKMLRRQLKIVRRPVV